MSIGSPSLEEIVAQLREAGIDTDDLDQRLTRARSAATSAMRAGTAAAAQPLETPRLLDAATRGYFLPADLGFTSEQDAPADPELQGLLAQCDVAQVRGRHMWMLKPEVRRQALKQAKASNTLAAAAERLPDEGDPEGSLLRRALKGFSPELERLADAELEQFATVADWLSGTDVARLPPAADVRRLIAKRELLQPFCTLVGRSLTDGSDGTKDRIVGRAKETEALGAYVGIVPAERLKDMASRGFTSLWQTITRSNAANEPLVINGIGGMGKSTLVAKFILDHALFPGLDLPFAYLDFDRSALAPREPLQLLIDISLQFSVWFPAIDAPLAKLRDDLRNSIDLLAANPGERSREDATRSRLHACCFQLQSIVESLNRGRAPVLLVFDTFEVAQYDDGAVKGVVDLISVLRAPAPTAGAQRAEPWSNLRIVVAGRAGADEIKTSQKPISLGPLSALETEKLIQRRNEIDTLDLTKPQRKALARPLSNSPLDVAIVMNWLKSRKPAERGALADEIVREVTSDEAGPDQPKEESLARRRITGILIDRMIKHINDPDVQKLANPGLVVRAVTPDVIRNVMAPASGLVATPQDLPSGAENELFRRLERERWLVTRSGTTVRHRPEVRLAMLDMMRRADRPRFDETNQLAVSYFRERAARDDEARAEMIYHLLLGGDANIEEAERLWKPRTAQFLLSAIDDVSGLAQVYLKAKLGRSVPIEALRVLPRSAAFSVLASFGKRFIQRGLSDGLSGIIDEVQRTERNPALLGLHWESLYRSGRWGELRRSATSDMASGVLAEVVAALRKSDFEAARAADAAAGLPLRFALRLATRDPQTAAAVFAQDLYPSQLDLGRASKVGEAFWDFATFMAHAAQRLPNFSDREGRERLIASIEEMSASDRKLPAAATTSGALRVLAFYETDPARPILQRLDFDGYFSTVSGHEVQQLRETFAAVSGRLRSAHGMRDVLARGEKLMKAVSEYPRDSVIADASLTRDFAFVVRGLAALGVPRASTGVLGLLAMTHPDWLEPMGHALTRAFRGEVPNDLGRWSSLKSYFGGGRPRRRPSDGHSILSMADEAGALAEAVQTFEKRLDRRDHEAEDFLDIARGFSDWTTALKTAVQSSAALWGSVV